MDSVSRSSFRNLSRILGKVSCAGAPSFFFAIQFCRLIILNKCIDATYVNVRVSSSIERFVTMVDDDGGEVLDQVPVADGMRLWTKGSMRWDARVESSTRRLDSPQPHR
jgi:hypothetical protein